MLNFEQSPFEAGESIYYAAVWLVAFCAGVSQTLRGGNYKHCWHSVNIGLVSGFLGFSVVSFIDGHARDRVGDEFYYLGIAVLIGLATQHQEKILTHFVNSMLAKFGYEETPGVNQDTQTGSSLPPMGSGTGDTRVHDVLHESDTSQPTRTRDSWRMDDDNQCQGESSPNADPRTDPSE